MAQRDKSGKCVENADCDLQELLTEIILLPFPVLILSASAKPLPTDMPVGGRMLEQSESSNSSESGTNDGYLGRHPSKATVYRETLCPNRLLRPRQLVGNINFGPTRIDFSTDPQSDNSMAL